VLLTLTIIIFVAIPRTALSITRHSGICTDFIIIILVNYLIPIQRSNGQDVAWLVLPAPRSLNIYTEIIATVRTTTLGGAFNLPGNGSLLIVVIYLIPEGPGVVPPPIIDLVAGFVKRLPNICAEDCPPLLERRTPALGVCPQ
jgi:hypothetical protein